MKKNYLAMLLVLIMVFSISAGVCAANPDPNVLKISYSTDSTDGKNGTWTTSINSAKDYKWVANPDGELSLEGKDSLWIKAVAGASYADKINSFGISWQCENPSGGTIHYEYNDVKIGDAVKVPLNRVGADSDFIITVRTSASYPNSTAPYHCNGIVKSNGPHSEIMTPKLGEYKNDQQEITLYKADDGFHSIINQEVNKLNPGQPAVGNINDYFFEISNDASSISDMKIAVGCSVNAYMSVFEDENKVTLTADKEYKFRKSPTETSATFTGVIAKGAVFTKQEILNVTQNKTYKSLAAAIAALEDGDTIQLSAGTFSPTGNDQMRIRKNNITLQGKGIDNTTIDLKGEHSVLAQAGILFEGNNCTIKDMKVVGTHTDGNVSAIKFSKVGGGANPLPIIDGGRIENVEVASTKGHAINIHGADNIVINNAKVTVAGKVAIGMANSQNVKIENCDLSEVKAGWPSDVAMFYSKKSEALSYARPVDVTFGEGNKFSYGAVCSERPSDAMGGVDIINGLEKVLPVVGSSENGVFGLFNTIQKAVNADGNYSIIRIPAGTYDEYVRAFPLSNHSQEKSITILGANAENNPNGDGWNKEETVITGGMYLGYDDSHTRDNAITVKGITFKTKGLAITDEKTVVVENNKFIDTTMNPGSNTENSATAALAVMDQSYDSHTGSVVVKNNYFKNNSGANASGIRLRNPGSASVEGNYLEDIEHNGILVETATKVNSPNALINITNNVIKNWDANNDEDGGRAIRVAFTNKAANDHNKVSITGNELIKTDWAKNPADKDIVKITNTSDALNLDLKYNYWNSDSPIFKTILNVPVNSNYTLYPYYADSAKTQLKIGPSSIDAAPLADNVKNEDGSVTSTPINLATYKTSLSGSTIYITAKNVPYHTNGAGNEGNWVGVQIGMPQDIDVTASNVTYAFGDKVVVAPTEKIGAFDVIDGKNYYTFYANPSDNPKTKISIDWDGTEGGLLPVHYNLNFSSVSVLSKPSENFEVTSVSAVTEESDYNIDADKQTIPVFTGNEIKLAGVIPYFKDGNANLELEKGNLFSIKISTDNVGTDAKLKVQTKDETKEYAMAAKLNGGTDFFLCGNISKDEENIKFTIDQDGNWATTHDAKTYTITWSTATFATEKVTIVETVATEVSKEIPLDQQVAVQDSIAKTRVRGIATASASTVNDYVNNLEGTEDKPAEVDVFVKVSALSQTNIENNILAFEAKPYVQQKVIAGVETAPAMPVDNKDLSGDITLCFALPSGFVAEGLQVRHVKENGKTDYLVPRIFTEVEAHGSIGIYAEVTIQDFSAIIIENSSTFNITYVSNLPKDVAFVNPNKIVELKVSDGVLPMQLKDPSAEGYVFDSWILAKNDGSVEKITELTGNNINDVAHDKNVKIYAQWSSFNPTVTFNHNYENAPANIDVQVVKGNKVVAPANSNREGYTFDGWYADKECTEAIDFSAEIHASVTYFAKWVEEVASINPPTPPVMGVAYADVMGHWAIDAIAHMTAQGLLKGEIVNGVSFFYPERAMSRAEFVTVLGRMDKVDAAKYENSDYTFTDINAGVQSWAGSYIAWAQKNQIVKGNSNTEFAPNKEISRQEMGQIIGNFLAYRTIKIEAKWDDVNFKDKSDIADWAQDSAAICVKANIIKGFEDGNYYPLKSMTRAEGATVIQRILTIINSSN